MTPHDAAVVDTNVIAALKLYDPAELPGMMLVTAVTLGELSFGPHATDDPVKRAGRVGVLQHVEATFDPLPYDTGAARLFGPDDRRHGGEQRTPAVHRQPRRLQGRRSLRSNRRSKSTPK